MTMNEQWIRQRIEEHREVLRQMETQLPQVAEAAAVCREALEKGHKILLCGNGGSAADAQHIAAEFMGRYHAERRSLPAVALTTDTSILTAVANDYEYSRVFARQIEGLGEKGDVFWGISTSGNSANVNEAALMAGQKGLKRIAFTGKDGGALAEICETAVTVPSRTTARIQEMHILCAHMICESIDEWISRP